MTSQKKFYSEVSLGPDEAGRAAMLLLDGRAVKTPGKAPLKLPSTALAEAVAAEWDAQGEEIDPATMPLTRLANTAIDGVTPAAEAVREDLVSFAGSDLLCYRAEGPEGLIALQREKWDPVLAWAEETLGARFRLAEGVIYIDQPEAAVAKIRAALAPLDPFQLTALHVMTALTGSILLGLAVARGKLSPDEAWEAAHIDEDWQARLWGEDAEAMARRAHRHRDFAVAAKMLSLL